ncbi:hypothetical protein LCGC14_2183790, partial [marine sediment metagenome]
VYGFVPVNESAFKPIFVSSPLNTTKLHVWAQIYDAKSKAWVNYDGTGTVAIRDSINVSSITDNGGVGDYTVNFTTAFATTDYCTTLGVAVNGTTSSTFSIRYVADSITTTSIQIRVGGTTVDSALNAPAVNVMCVGNL